MKDKYDHINSASGDPADALLQQLFHLKGYEKPDAARMTRNKQNIMRQVREIHGRKRRSLADLLVVNVPWFFSEPRYGIAALFIVFATLQFWGVNTQKHIRNKSDIYTRDNSLVLAAPLPVSSAYTNSIIYPEIPDNLDLFPAQQTDGGIMFVGLKKEIEE